MIKNHRDINMFQLERDEKVERLLEREWTVGVWAWVLVTVTVVVIVGLLVGNIVLGLN